MFRKWRRKDRFCTNLCEEDLLRLRRSAGLLEDESVCLLIDDSLLVKRTKNVILTDRRILWQEKRGAPYRSVLLSALEGSSVFARQRGFVSVITILNGDECVSLVFKNIRECEPLRIVFHDYLFRCCANYNPLGEENVRRYEKEILSTQRKGDIVSAVLAAAGGVFFLAMVLTDKGVVFPNALKSMKFDVRRKIETIMLGMAIICWVTNIIIPASKSKMLKSNLLIISIVYFALLAVSPLFGTGGEFGFFGFTLATVFLLADRFDCYRLEPMLAVFAMLIVILFLVYGI